MRGLIIVLSLFLFCTQVVFANEAQSIQQVENNQSYFTANIQKQPQNSKQKQAISNHFTFFTINVQVNGKIEDIRGRIDGE